MKNKANFINREKIEGYVYSTGSGFNQLSTRTAGEKAKNPGAEYIAGDLDIAVDENGLNVITVHYSYVTPQTKKGTPNGTYATLKKIIDSPDRTWLTGGKDNAIKVQCTGVAIAVNDFIASDGSKVAALRNENGFCNIVNDLGPEADRNTFMTDMLIAKVTHVDANEERGIKDDFTRVSGCIFGYGAEIPTLIPATFVVRNPGGMNYFEDLEVTQKDPVFTKVWGRINCMTIRTERVEESAWGEAMVTPSEKKSREYVITGTAKIPYEFGNKDVLTAEDVNKMNQNRQIKLAEIESRFKENQKNTATTSSFPTESVPVASGDFNFDMSNW